MKDPERIQTQYAAGAEGWSGRYADAASYLSHRAELIVSLGPALEPGDRVLDLACGDGALASFLPGMQYPGVDASPEMVAAARRNGVAAELGDLNDYAPAEPVAATVSSARSTTRATATRSSATSPATRSGSSSSTSIRASTGSTTSAPTSAPRGSPG